MKENCSNCEYFVQDGMEKGKHLCVLKEKIIKSPDDTKCQEHIRK